MRCPKCRRKVHPDDISCLYCSASLRQRPSAPGAASPGIPRTNRPVGADRKPNRGKTVALILAVIGLCLFLPGIFLAVVLLLNSPLEYQSVSIAPEPAYADSAHPDAQPLHLPMATGEELVITAESIYVSDYDGELEILYSAKNTSGRPLICSEVLTCADGIGLENLMYLELAPGETGQGWLWIEAEGLLPLGVDRIEQLTLSFRLTDGEDYTDLGWTDPVDLPVDARLPALPDSHQVSGLELYGQKDVTLTLLGLTPDTESGQITLYLLAQNDTGSPASLFLENARCGDTDLGLYGFFDLPPSMPMLIREPLFDVPFASGQETVVNLRLQVHQENGEDSAAVTLTLSPDGSLTGGEVWQTE